jgi:hypothetical protein
MFNKGLQKHSRVRKFEIWIFSYYVLTARFCLELVRILNVDVYWTHSKQYTITQRRAAMKMARGLLSRAAWRERGVFLWRRSCLQDLEVNLSSCLVFYSFVCSVGVTCGCTTGLQLTQLCSNRTVPSCLFLLMLLTGYYSCPRTSRSHIRKKTTCWQTVRVGSIQLSLLMIIAIFI